MIEKVIHYCWFGGQPLPKKVKNCIHSWEKMCPDYKIIEWNEKNYNIKKNKYMYDAYLAKKWAFVSDYARIDIIYNYGGIYLDTDVELVRSLDNFLDFSMFCGWEKRDKMLDKNNIEYENSINFGLGYGAIRGHPALKDLLDLYDNINFYLKNGEMNLIACPHYQTQILKKYGLDDSKRSLQVLMNDIHVFPEDYFSPKSQTTGRIILTENTVSIHHFSLTWVKPSDRFVSCVEQYFRKVFSYKISHILVLIVFAPLLLIRKIRK